MTQPVAIVTGAAQGLGRAEALGLVSRGWSVVVNDVDRESVEELAGDIQRDGGQCVAHVGDVSSEADASAMVEAALGAFGKLDALVNNAGTLADAMVFNMELSDWERILRVNLTGTFLPCRAASRYWRDLSKRQGSPVDAAIVNTTSRAGLFGNPGQSNYGSAKSGVAMLTLILARELRRYGVRCNAIAPRAYTPLMASAMGDFEEAEIAEWSPERVADVVSVLVHPDSKPMTGQALVVQGRHVSLIAPWTEVASVQLDTSDSIAGGLRRLFSDRPSELADFDVASGLPLRERDS